MPLQSAGLLLYRHTPEGPEFLLVHPGGPFFTHKDKGWWGIPKGLPNDGEPLEEAARREFAEEIGFLPEGESIPLGEVKQKGGKIVHAWAVEGDLPENWQLHSNTFRAEWPPRSGQWQSFPEVDKAAFLSTEAALEYILEAQQPFITRLLDHINSNKQ